MGFGFRVWSPGFKVWGVGLRVCDHIRDGKDREVSDPAVCPHHLHCHLVWVSGFGFRVSGFGFRVSGFGFRVSGSEFRVAGFGFATCGIRPEGAE